MRCSAHGKIGAPGPLEAPPPRTIPRMATDVVAPSRSRAGLAIAGAIAATIPALTVRLGGLHPKPVVAAMIFGIAVVGAAFMLAWAAEVVQLDISAGLALALLALIAVLPEYAVDFVFTWKAGTAVAHHGLACLAPGSPDESPCSLALANMTGANRLLIGVGWSMVVGMAWLG